MQIYIKYRSPTHRHCERRAPFLGSKARRGNPVIKAFAKRLYKKEILSLRDLFNWVAAPGFASKGKHAARNDGASEKNTPLKLAHCVLCLFLSIIYFTPLFAMMQPEDDPDVIATFEGYESCLSEDEADNDANIPELPPDHQARDWGTVAFWVADIGCLAAIFVGLPVWAYLDQEARQRMMGMEMG